MNSSKKLIQTYYDAFNAKRYTDMLSLLTDNVIHDSNQGNRTIGKDAFKTFLIEMDRFYDERLEDIILMSDESGQRVAAEFMCSGTYKASAPALPAARNQRYRLAVGCFFEIKGDKIARVTNYYNLKDWLEQVR